MKVASLVKVIWEHLFYENRIMKGLTVMPTDQTNRIMNKMGIFWKMRSNELELAYNLDKLKLFLTDESQRIMLTFYLKNSDVNFRSISKISMYLPHKELFYFTNLNRGIEEDGESIQLVGDKLKIASDKDLFKIKNPYFEFKSKIEDKKVFFIEDAKILSVEGEILGESIKGKEIKIRETQVSLHENAPNLFVFEQEDSVDNEEFYCFPSSMSHSFGMLHLYIDKTMLEKENKSFQIQFLNRKTIWRYYFVSDKINDKSDIVISHPTKDISFTVAKEETILPNGQMAWMVSSNEPIPLCERTEHYFSAFFVLDTESGRRNNILLPNAEPAMIQVEGEGISQKIYSDIYVMI